jgi:ferric-dicitrate binding protein FerR (iron transport regulator)
MAAGGGDFASRRFFDVRHAATWRVPGMQGHGFIARTLVAGVTAFGAPALAHAAAGDQIGSAILIENIVTADYARETRTLQDGDRVRQDEIIEVGLDARSEFELNDDTKLALGPGTRLTLDKFVYDPDKATGTIILNMAKGTMRWVTGVAKKPTYTIRVPNASITVRGTIFDLYVTEVGETWLLLHEGAVRVCNERGQCRVHEESCKLTRISSAGDVDRPAKWGALPGARDNMFHRAFPFVVIPPKIDPNPICTRDGVTRQRDASGPPPRNDDYEPPVKTRKAEAERTYVPTSTSAAVPPRVSRPPRIVSVPVPYPADDDDEPKKRRIKEIELPKLKYREVKLPRIRLSDRIRDRDDDDDHNDRHRPRRRGGSGIGRAILGAAVLGAAALAIGSMRGHRGGHGGY